MTFQWTLVAWFMYVEMACVVLLLFPYISPTRWQSIFRCRAVSWIGTYFSIYFKVILLLLAVLGLDAYRTSHKYSSQKYKDGFVDGHTKDHMHMTKFLAQRNLYITFFSLFLWLILARLVKLISAQAQQTASNEAAIRQAKSASQTAQHLMDQADQQRMFTKKSSSESATKECDTLSQELQDSRSDLSDTQKALKRAHVDLETVRKQSKQNDAQYDRLMKEHETVQKRLAELECQDGSKKSS